MVSGGAPSHRSHKTEPKLCRALDDLPQCVDRQRLPCLRVQGSRAASRPLEARRHRLGPSLQQVRDAAQDPAIIGLRLGVCDRMAVGARCSAKYFTTRSISQNTTPSLTPSRLLVDQRRLRAKRASDRISFSSNRKAPPTRLPTADRSHDPSLDRIAASFRCIKPLPLLTTMWDSSSARRNMAPG